MQLFNASARALKSVDSRLRVGGPATARLDRTVEFVQQCAAQAVPFDFVSSHMYPTDPQCAHVGAGWSADCLSDHVRLARRQLPASVPLYLTEYNVGCCLENPSRGGGEDHDSAAAAAFAFRTVAALDGVVDVLSWWTFTDVFEEAGLPGKEFSNVYGLMTVSGVPKPSWRAFQLLATAGTARLPVNVTVHRGASGPPTPTPTPAPPATAPTASAAAAAPCAEAKGSVLTGFPVGSPVAAADAQACCAACVNVSACQFWSFRAANASCAFQSSDAGRAANAAFVSGSRVQPPPPPPPPSANRSQRVAAMATTAATTPAGSGSGSGGEHSAAAAAGKEARVVKVFLSSPYNRGAEPDANHTVRVRIAHAAGATITATGARQTADPHRRRAREPAGGVAGDGGASRAVRGARSSSTRCRRPPRCRRSRSTASQPDPRRLRSAWCFRRRPR
jgi:hypothetical protein